MLYQFFLAMYYFKQHRTCSSVLEWIITAVRMGNCHDKNIGNARERTYRYSGSCNTDATTQYNKQRNHYEKFSSVDPDYRENESGYVSLHGYIYKKETWKGFGKIVRFYFHIITWFHGGFYAWICSFKLNC